MAGMESDKVPVIDPLIDPLSSSLSESLTIHASCSVRTQTMQPMEPVASGYIDKGNKLPLPPRNSAKYWADIGQQSRLRVSNMRIMHSLNVATARANLLLLQKGSGKGTPGPSQQYVPQSALRTQHDTSKQSLIRSRNDLSKPGLQKGPENLRNFFDDLPDDILVSVFSYLSYPELITCQRVSKGWRSYLVSEPAFHRHVSFLNSKHPIPLKAIRTAITIAENRIRSMEFNASTLVHLTPLAPIFPYLERLVITQKTGYLSTLFLIMFRQENWGPFHQLPSLRTAIFQHGMLLSNEVIILLSTAPNLEHLECRSARVLLDFLQLTDNSTQWRLKKLRIEHYSEQMTSLPSLEEPVQSRVIRTPSILRFLPDLEELTLGIDALQVIDLTLNPKIRYLDFLPRSAVVSFIQPPPSLKVCLNAPVLCRHLPDSHPAIWPPGGELLPLLGNRIQLWRDPPALESLSLSRVPSDIDILPRALCNSCNSLVALQIHFTSGIWSVRDLRAEELITQHMEQLAEFLARFQNLRYLDVSESSYVGDGFLARLPPLSLEYLCLARTSVTLRGVLHFLSKAKTTLREINVIETQVGAEVGELAASLGVKMEISYPGKPIPGANI